VKVEFHLNSERDKHLLNFFLGEKGVESIVEVAEGVNAYFKEQQWITVADFFEKYSPEVSTVPNENWNAVWEASFEPVNINDFCYVRAPFHPALETEKIIDLILEPKMAFGTAHHETTFMMMSEMENIDFNGSDVFDFGCGTAILSVLAEKLGASQIFAIDIEENAIENSIYNCSKNNCENIICEQAVLDEIEVKSYDNILANINRQVLLDSAEPLIPFLRPNGTLLISGILIEDEKLVKNCYTKAGFTHISTREKGEWKCMKFTKI